MINLVLSLSFSHTGHWKFNMAPHGKELSEDLKASAFQCSDHTPHTASNWSAWLSSQKEFSSKDDAQESPQTVR